MTQFFISKISVYAFQDPHILILLMLELFFP